MEAFHIFCIRSNSFIYCVYLFLFVLFLLIKCNMLLNTVTVIWRNILFFFYKKLFITAL